LLDLLEKANQISEARKVMSRMVEADLKHNVMTFNALICSYAKAGMPLSLKNHLTTWFNLASK
jgi:pentatricopeptide repeat protein